MAKKEVNLKVLITQEDRDKLGKLSLHLERSMSDVVREMIRARYDMQMKAIPTCANGGNCLVAGMFLTRNQKPQLVEVIPDGEEFRSIGPPIPAEVR